jgi:hypothetical protein
MEVEQRIARGTVGGATGGVRSIVVGIDGTPASEKVLHWALDEPAQSAHAKGMVRGGPVAFWCDEPH